MRREVLAQCGGQFVNSDGTFRSAGKVMDDAACLFFVMGEDAKIHTYGAVESERQEQVHPLFQRCGPLGVFLLT